MASFPYPVYGTITDSDSNQVSTRVVLRNDRTGEKINKTSLTNGKYILEAANLASGYMDTDRLTVISSYGDEEKESSFLISDYGGGHNVDLELATISESSDTTYCQPQDVLDELGDKTTSDISYERLRKIILRSESEIDERSNSKFTSTTVTDEMYNFDQYSTWQGPEQLRYYSTSQLVGTRSDHWNSWFNDKIQLKKRPVISITSLSSNSQGYGEVDSWTELTEQTGSGGDFYFNPNTGIVTFMKNFPVQGTRKMKVTYVYGTATTPKVVERLCILLSVRDVLTSKTNNNQFSPGDISVDGFSMSDNIGASVTYMNWISREIESLWSVVGALGKQFTG